MSIASSTLRFPIVAALCFAARDVSVRASEPATPKEVTKAAFEARVRNDRAALRRFVVGSEPILHQHDCAAELEQARADFAAAEAKRFGGDAKIVRHKEMLEVLSQEAKWTEEIRHGDEAIVSYPRGFTRLAKIGSTWKIDYRDLTGVPAEELEKQEAETEALRAVTKKIEAGNYQTREEAEAAVAEAKRHPSGRKPNAPTELTIDVFYNYLEHGHWYKVPDYGYVWQPDVARDPQWRPYTHGYWVYTDQGWFWSGEEFGWATYHYGRWAAVSGHGWVWVPGKEWAPAWVSWRAGGDYIGWAPLPPLGREQDSSGKPISGNVDSDFGIGPGYYNFADIHDFTDVTIPRFVKPSENLAIIKNTVNVTNIRREGSTVCTFGPDYATVNRYADPRVSRDKIIWRDADFVRAVEQKAAINNATVISTTRMLYKENQQVPQGYDEFLIIGSPPRFADARAAPYALEGTIDGPKIDTGWANIAPEEKADLEHRYATLTAKDLAQPTERAAKDRRRRGLSEDDKKVLGVAAGIAGALFVGGKLLDAAGVSTGNSGIQSGNSPQPCFACGGRGSVQVYERSMSGGSMVLTSRTCSACGGSGHR